MSVPDEALPGPATLRVELKSATGKRAASTSFPVRIVEPAAK